MSGGTSITGRATVAEVPTAKRAVPARLNSLDWLRVLALLGVFVYHGLRPFDTEDWHVKNAEQSSAITVLLALIAWGLALFFLLAGAGSGLALRWRTPAQYARERLLRLAVPLVVAYLISPRCRRSSRRLTTAATTALSSPACRSSSRRNGQTFGRDPSSP
jgi:peptidoglycan/LPS O-acetylase OafA/YrhL